MKAKFVRHSVCECGFPILSDGIPLGTIYEIDYSRMKRIAVICGGCKKYIPLTGVWVESRDGCRPGYLPENIFEPIEEKPAEARKEP